MHPPPRYTIKLVPHERCTPPPLRIQLEGSHGTATALVHAGPTHSLALEAYMHSSLPLGTLTAVTVAMQPEDGALTVAPHTPS